MCSKLLRVTVYTLYIHIVRFQGSRHRAICRVIGAQNGAPCETGRFPWETEGFRYRKY